VQGLYSLLGAVSGKCKIIKDFDALTRGELTINADDILIAAKTSNYWNQYLSDLRGIITMDGSPTAHPMLIGRERNLAVICGVHSLVEKLEPLDGLDITMDGLTKSVYKGIKPLRTATREEFEEMFAVQKPAKQLADTESVELLKAYAGRLVTVAGQNFVRTPNSPITPVWAEMQMKALNSKIALINQAREDKLEETQFTKQTKYHEGYVIQEFWSEAKSLTSFDGMTLSEVKKYHGLVQNWQREYMEACKGFLDRPDLVHWKGYTYAYPQLYGALDNAWVCEAYLRSRS